MCKTKFYCSPLPKTHLPFLALLRGVPLRTPKWVNGEGGGSDVFMRVCGANAGEVCNCTPSEVCTHTLNEVYHRTPSEVCTHTLNEVYHRTLSEVCTHTRTRRIYYPFPASSPPCKDSCI